MERCAPYNVYAMAHSIVLSQIRRKMISQHIPNPFKYVEQTNKIQIFIH